MKLTSRDFQKAAEQRLTTAEFLLESGYTLDALYLGGYAFECSLKALILEKTSPAHREEIYEKITSGSSMHKPEILIAELRDLGILLPLPLAKRLRLQWSNKAEYEPGRWSVALRYQHGRKDSGMTRGVLKTAKLVCEWVEGQLP